MSGASPERTDAADVCIDAKSISAAMLERGQFTRTEAIIVAVASMGFALIFCYPMLKFLGTEGTFNDWDFWLSAQLVSYRSVVRHFQFPLWNPYLCGGTPLLGDPQSHFLTPWFVLTLIFGPVIGLHLEVIIHAAIAWSGGYVLGRLLGMRRISAICTATTFVGSSWYYLRASEGHFPLLACAYLPWIIAAAWYGSSRGSHRYSVIAGSLIALSFLEAGPYPAVYEVLVLAILLVPLAMSKFSPRPLLALALAAVFAAGFCAIKYIPARDVIAIHPRPTDAGYSSSIPALAQALFSRNQDHDQPSPIPRGFHELGAYVGLFAALAAVGLFAPRRSFPWLIAAVVLFALARGWTSPSCPWVWLHRLPLFSSTRLPSRLLVPFTLVIGVMAGFGVDVICKRESILALGAAALVILAGAADLLLVGPPNLRYIEKNVVPPNPPRTAFEQIRRPLALPMLVLVEQNQGVLNCYEYSEWTTPVLGSNDAGYRGEQYMKGPGTVQLTRWTPNVLEYEINAPAPTEMIVNQNYDPYWTIGRGAGELVSENGLLAVRVKAGRQHVVLSYGGWPWKVGALVTFATFLVAMWLLRRGGPSLSVHSNRRAI